MLDISVETIANLAYKQICDYRKSLQLFKVFVHISNKDVSKRMAACKNYL